MAPKAASCPSPTRPTENAHCRVFQSFLSLEPARESSCFLGFLHSALSLPPWAALGAQPVKTLPAVREARAPSLGWEDPPEKGKAARSAVSAWRPLWTV